MFDGSVHAFVGVASDEGEVLPEGVQSAAIQNDFVLLEEGVAGREAAVDNVVLVELDDCFSDPDG